MATEAEVQNSIRLAINRGDTRVFRNHCGRVQDARSGRWHVFGLAPGSSDLIGIRRVRITPEMVGQTVGLFVAVEVKSPTGGRVSPEQSAFLDFVTGFGGIAGIAKSADEALAIVGRFPPAPASDNSHYVADAEG
jgi:hypothetical protein